jgi:hypothetical protein
MFPLHNSCQVGSVLLLASIYRECEDRRVRSRVGDTTFPDEPGAYVVYEAKNAAGPLYVGVAAGQTIRQRWTRQHLKARSGGSALRRTLGVHRGLVFEKLKRPERYYPAQVEEAITAFLQDCWVEVRPTTAAASAKALESTLIATVDPVLNVQRR